MVLRNWISILIPKAEDGNNFGVEVQEQCLVKLVGKFQLQMFLNLKLIISEVEKEMLMVVELMAAYHLERSQILGKLITCPDIEDYS